MYSIAKLLLYIHLLVWFPYSPALHTITILRYVIQLLYDTLCLCVWREAGGSADTFSKITIICGIHKSMRVDQEGGAASSQQQLNERLNIVVRCLT